MVPTSTNLKVNAASRIPASSQAVVVFAIEDEKFRSSAALSEAENRAAKRLLDLGIAKAKFREIRFDLVEDSKGKVKQVYIVGLGKGKEVNLERMRQASAALCKAIRKGDLQRVAVVLPNLKLQSSDLAEAVTTGALLSAFEYRDYKGKGTKSDNKKNRQIDVTIVGDGSDVGRSVETAQTIATGQNFARHTAFRPGNDINPPALAGVAKQLASEVGIKIRILDEKEMKRLGMGGILAVGSGSQLTPPRMIVLEYRGKGSTMKQPLLVIGKSITFDTGGISIKSADKMGSMVFDKCGGMAVLGMMYALAKLKTPAHVVGILSSAENHISAASYRPGDILRMYNGVTVEVTNTDAEGRLVLGDALAWGIEQYKPSAVVDLATLTGGVVVALGNSMAGVMCNDKALFNQLQQAADATGEKIWRLPISDDVREQIKSQTADIMNSAGRGASPLQGSEFLRYFVPEGTPWAHFDIAGVADTEKELPYYGKGATGWGVRTLVEWVRRQV